MNTNKYLAFLETVKYESITRAAKEINYTQSAVSQMIHSLEKEFDVQLLHRNNDRVLPTKEAEMILPYVRNIVNNEQYLYDMINQINHIETGTIRIGTYISIMQSFLAALMHLYHEDHPGIKLSVIEGNTQELAQFLREGSIDFAFVAGDDFHGFEFIPIAKDELKVVVPQSSPLSKKNLISPKELFEYPVISTEEGSEEDLLKICEIAGVHPEINLRAKSELSILSMISCNLGVAIIPSLYLNTHRPGISIRNLDCSWNHRQIGIILNSKDDLSPASRNFIDSIPEDINKLINIQVNEPTLLQF